MNETARHWLMFARQDLRMAELALSEDIYNHTCFHAQQCAEKAIKGYLEQLGRSPPRTPMMADLFVLLPADLLDTLEDALFRFDRFYIPTRYPDALPGTLSDGLPGRQDARDALATARETLARIEELVQSD